MKPVIAGPGDRVCNSAEGLFVNDRLQEHFPIIRNQPAAPPPTQCEGTLWVVGRGGGPAPTSFDRKMLWPSQ